MALLGKSKEAAANIPVDQVGVTLVQPKPLGVEMKTTPMKNDGVTGGGVGALEPVGFEKSMSSVVLQEPKSGR